MRRIIQRAVLALAGVILTAGMANAQYRYTSQYNPYLGGYVSQAYVGSPYGIQTAQGFYSPYTGANYTTYQATVPYYGSYGTSYGYNPYYGSSYYRAYNATPFGRYRYGYATSPYGSYRYGYGY